MDWRAFVPFLFVLPALAGCLAPAVEVAPASATPAELTGLTEAVYDVLGHFEHRFEGTTGTQLYVDYFRPDTPDDVKSPVILVFTPYQDPTPGELVPLFDDAPYRAALVDDYVPRGYTVAFADVRGNHKAGGCIDQTGPEQWQDGYDYVEWLGAQDWSNGNVGMWGVSYDAETQFTTAMMAPPSLKTIVPVASVSSQYEWNFYQGVPYEMQPLIGMGSYFAGSATPSSSPEDAPLYAEKLECQPEQFAAGTDFSGDMTPFWKERDYRGMAGQIKASVLHVHGLQDWNVRPIHIDPLFTDITSEKRAIFGQWHHALPDREDWDTILHAWYDHWLFGIDNGIMQMLPPVLIEADDQQWYGLEAFPPTDAAWLEMELSGDGTLVAPGNASAGEFLIHDYRQEAVGEVGVNGFVAMGQALVAGHPNQVSWTWTTTEDLLVIGRPEVSFTATTDQKSTHWVVELLVDGKNCAYKFHERELVPGICDNVGYQDTRHLEGLDNPKDLTPGEAYDITVRMFPQADVIPKGSKVTLRLTNNNDDIQQDTTGAMNTIFTGGETPALLRLPLAPTNRVALPHDTLPMPFAGFAA